MPTRVYPESAIETALRGYQEARDRLRDSEARIEANVMADFRLNANTGAQAHDLLIKSAAAHLALEHLASVVAAEENDHAKDDRAEAEECEVAA